MHVCLGAQPVQLCIRQRPGSCLPASCLLHSLGRCICPEKDGLLLPGGVPVGARGTGSSRAGQRQAWASMRRQEGGAKPCTPAHPPLPYQLPRPPAHLL